jgi:hypothetical protein
VTDWIGAVIGWCRTTWRFVADTTPLSGLDDRLRRRLQWRQDRKFNWDLFVRLGPEMFRTLAAPDWRVQEFNKLYHFVITPRGRSGGRDERMFEVFFGGRPFDQVHHQSLDTVRHEFILEVGATLRYYRQDDDRVVIFLHPPVARNWEKQQRFYVLQVIRNRTLLTGSGALKRHLRYLIAMMEVYSIDGVPTVRDRLHVLWVERVKIRIVPPVENGPASGERPIQGLGRSVIEIVVLSGLSGWALLIIPLLWRLFFGGSGAVH